MPVTTAPRILVDDKEQLRQILQANPRSEDLLTIKEQEYARALTTKTKRSHYANLLLLISLVHEKWNGNRKGPIGHYPRRPKQLVPGTAGVYSKGEQYLGHNIAAIAVDGRNNVLDFDFNHNDIFRSSVEHAEARLVRRLFSLTGLRAGWSLGDAYDENEKNPFATALPEVTIYTSLEPCAECAGIMALARIKQVVYLQRDHGARRVANALYNLKPYGGAPLPIEAIRCGIGHGERLTEAHEKYWHEVQDPALPAFFRPLDPKLPEDRSPYLTSFLCTDTAMDLFEDGKKEFFAFKETGETPWGTVSRRQVKELAEFLDYATKGGHRGTPH